MAVKASYNEVGKNPAQIPLVWGGDSFVMEAVLNKHNSLLSRKRGIDWKEKGMLSLDTDYGYKLILL